MFTVTGTLTAGLNTTVQVSVTTDPTGRIGFGLLLDTIIDAGAGTVIEILIYRRLCTQFELTNVQEIKDKRL